MWCPRSDVSLKAYFINKTSGHVDRNIASFYITFYPGQLQVNLESALMVHPQ